MTISTKSRYALRVLIDLAEQQDQGFVSMNDIVSRQGISLKYIQKLMPVFSKNHIIETRSGKNGGYRMIIPANKCKVGDVLRMSEGSLNIISCDCCNDLPCEYSCECRTEWLWKNFQKITNEYFDSITIADLMKSNKEDLKNE